MFRRSGRPFTRTELARARTLCVPAAAAIVNARLYTDQLARAERTAVLLAIAESTGATLDLPAALDDISQRAARALDAERCTISVWPEGGAPAETPIGEAQAARSKRPVELDGGVLVVPIVRKGDPIGAMTLVARPRRRWERASLDLAVAIAGQVALVADNARLYREGQTKAERLVQGETLRALGELAGGAAHHLNNLLTIVVGRIQLLHRSVRDERVQRPLATIERAAKDAAEVVRRLQQFAGMRRTAQPRAVDLNEIVSEVLELTRDRWQDAARAAGLEIVVEPRLGLLPTLDGDAAAVRELLTNLVMNAIEAMPAGGRITVETRQERGHAILSVTDTGSGMSDEVRLRAHEPFFTTKGVKSTGLGLSVSYGIARRHGGEVTIRSQVGQGTTIVVQLPLPAVGVAEQPALPAVTHRPLRILLVDDEPDVRLALAEMLASEGHTVTPAGSGEEALRRLDIDASIELVLTDLVMPAMTGWEIAAAVKARRPALPVGVITGWGDLPETVAGPRASVDFVIAKPINLDELADRRRPPGRVAEQSPVVGDARGQSVTPRAERVARARAIMASRRRRCAQGSASEPPTNDGPAQPPWGMGGRASRARSELRRQASHAGARRATRSARGVAGRHVSHDAGCATRAAGRCVAHRRDRLAGRLRRRRARPLDRTASPGRSRGCTRDRPRREPGGRSARRARSSRPPA